MVVVDKPPWVDHSGEAIFSIHVCSRNERVATAGGDNTVKVWSAGTLRSLKKEVGPEAENRLLCIIGKHSGPVNVVRFSSCGKQLASGADDAVCCIHALQGAPGSTTGGVAGGGGGQDRGRNTLRLEGGTEQWQTVRFLREHGSNITDLTWSPDDSLLATASLDTTVVIWEASSGARLRHLKGHNSFVKGVTFDPVGRYLASQGDDKQVILWSTETWTAAATLTRPYGKTMGNTYALRSGWSPDGTTLATVNAWSNPKHTAAVLSRAEWQKGNQEPSYHLVGHKGPVVVAAFSPVMYKSDSALLKDQLDETAPPSCHCLALCSQDNKITVWLTALQRPLVTLKKPFQNSMTDMAWTPTGRELLVCSLDGTICRIAFDKTELGTPINKKEMKQRMVAMYGAIGAGAKYALVPSVALMAMEDAARRGVGQQENGRAAATATAVGGGAGAATVMKNKVAPAAATAAGVGAGVPRTEKHTLVPQQTEVRQSDGRRRIQLLPIGVANEEVPAVLAHNGESGQQQPRVPPALGSLGATIPPVVVQGVRPANGNGMAEKRRRIQPEAQKNGLAMMSSAAPAPAPAPAPAANAAGLHGNMLNGSAPANGGNVVRRAEAPGVSTMTMVLPSPPSERHLSVRLSIEAEPYVSTVDETRFTLEASNSGRWGAVIASEGGQCLWRDRLVGSVSLLTCTQWFSAATTTKGELMLWARSGRRVAPLLVMSSAPAFLATDGAWQLLYVGSNGDFVVYDVKSMSLALRGSASSLLLSADTDTDTDVTVTSMHLSKKGAPVAILSNNRTFLWHLGLECWTCIADTAFMSSDFASTRRPSSSSFSSSTSKQDDGELWSLQTPLHRGIGLPITTSLLSLPVSIQKDDTCHHLESLVVSSCLLGSWTEFRRWLQTYAGFLAKNGEEARLREMCEELLLAEDVRYSTVGGGEGLRKRRNASAGVCHDGGFEGEEEEPASERDKWEGRTVLRQVVLTAVATHREMHRLVEEFLEILDADGA